MLGSENEKRNPSPAESAIDEHLRRVYEEALEQEIPDRFHALIEELRKKESRK